MMMMMMMMMMTTAEVHRVRRENVQLLSRLFRRLLSRYSRTLLQRHPQLEARLVPGDVHRVGKHRFSGTLLPRRCANVRQWPRQ